MAEASEARREWTLVGLGLTALLAIVVGIVAVVALATPGDRAGSRATVVTGAARPPAVDRELWATQQEFSIGKPGGQADMAKLKAKQPDVIAFNGYADQYRDATISVRKGERIRMYVLNAGPSVWSAFHVIGTVFDSVHTDNGTARDVQTINLAPSQGGWVEFTLDEEGSYPLRHPCVRRHGQGRARRPEDPARARRPRPLIPRGTPRPHGRGRGAQRRPVQVPRLSVQREA